MSTDDSGAVSGFDQVKNLEPDAYGGAGENNGNAEKKQYGKDCHVGAPHNIKQLRLQE